LTKIIARGYGLFERISEGLKSRVFFYRPEGTEMKIEVEVTQNSDDMEIKASVKGARGQASAVNWASRVLFLLALYLGEEGSVSISNSVSSGNSGEQSGH